jgi:hemoglobin-like flavoprotein
MWIILFIGCLAVCSLGDTQLVCGPLQRIKIWRQWRKAYGEGSQRLLFSTRFWSKFFKADPKIRVLYKPYGSDNIYSPKFLAFTQRLFASFTLQLELVDDADTKRAIMTSAKAFYDELNIPFEAYEMFDDILMEILAEYLGRYTDLDAWKACLLYFNHQFQSFIKRPS